MDTQETGIQLAGSREAQVMDSSNTAASAREAGLIQAQFTMAMQRPRREQEAFARVLEATQRPTFAATAIYTFPRAGENIEGPSVNMAREAARCWGNIQAGYRVVDINAQFFRVQGFALDLETNTLKIVEVAQKNLIYRKSASKSYGSQTGWVTPDERDAREMQAKAGAIAERNAIIQVLPKDAVDDWMRSCKETLSKSVKQEIGSDREGYLRRTVVAFRRFMVTQEMIEEYLGSPLSDMSRQQAVELQGIYKAMEDGQATRDDFFQVPEVGKPAASGLDAVAAAAKKRGKKGPKKGATSSKLKPASGKDKPKTAKSAPARAPERADKTAEARLKDIAAASQEQQDAKFEELNESQKQQQQSTMME